MKRSSPKPQSKWYHQRKVFPEYGWTFSKDAEGKTVALHPNGLPVLRNSSKGTHFTSDELREAVGAVFEKNSGKKRQLSAAKH